MSSGNDSGIQNSQTDASKIYGFSLILIFSTMGLYQNTNRIISGRLSKHRPQTFLSAKDAKISKVCPLPLGR